MIEAATEALVAEQAEHVRALVRAGLPITNVERTGTTVFISFDHPRNGKPYVLRYRCDGYPLNPPSVHFVEPSSREDSSPAVWPSDGEQAIKTSANPRFVCLPGTREYYQAGHGQFLPDVHSVSLAVIFQHLMQALELRG